jgi:hypothetical protein
VIPKSALGGRSDAEYFVVDGDGADAAAAAAAATGDDGSRIGRGTGGRSGATRNNTALLDAEYDAFHPKFCRLLPDAVRVISLRG